MFVYPFGGASKYITEEYVLISGYVEGITGLAYYAVTPTSVTPVASKPTPGNYTNWAASNGTHVFHRGATNTTQGVSICQFDGIAGFTTPTEASAGHNIYYNGFKWFPSHPNLLMGAGHTDFERRSYFHTIDLNTPAIPAASNLYHDANSRNAASIMDFRRGTKGYGDNFVWPYYNGPGVFIVKDIAQDGSSATSAGYTAAVIGGLTQSAGWDRDYGRIFRTSFSMSEVDFDAETFSTPVTLTGHGLSATYGITGFEGYVVAMGSRDPDGIEVLRSYTISGTELVLAGEYEYGNVGTGGNTQVVTSPYTGYVYVLGMGAATSGAFSISQADGSISLIDTFSYSNSTGLIENNFHFLGGTPLPAAQVSSSITHVGTTSINNQDADTNTSAPLPSGLEVGDLLIVSIQARNTIISSGPSGFTEIANYAMGSSSITTPITTEDDQFRLYTRVVDGTEGSSVTWEITTTGNEGQAIICSAWRGVSSYTVDNFIRTGTITGPAVSSGDVVLTYNGTTYDTSGDVRPPNNYYKLAGEWSPTRYNGAQFAYSLIVSDGTAPDITWPTTWNGYNIMFSLHLDQ